MFDESEVIGGCALRMDGWRYVEEAGLDPDAALAHFFEKGSWNVPTQDLMAVFFIIQRAMRWNLEYEPPTGRYWRAFRELYLRLCQIDVPEKYRHPEGHAAWREEYLPCLGRDMERVGRIHKGTKYDDASSVTDRLLSPHHHLLRKDK